MLQETLQKPSIEMIKPFTGLNESTTSTLLLQLTFSSLDALDQFIHSLKKTIGKENISNALTIWKINVTIFSNSIDEIHTKLIEHFWNVETLSLVLTNLAPASLTEDGKLAEDQSVENNAITRFCCLLLFDVLKDQQKTFS